MPTITVTVPTGKANNFMHRAKVRAGLGGLLLRSKVPLPGPDVFKGLGALFSRAVAPLPGPNVFPSRGVGAFFVQAPKTIFPGPNVFQKFMGGRPSPNRNPLACPCQMLKKRRGMGQDPNLDLGYDPSALLTVGGSENPYGAQSIYGLSPSAGAPTYDVGITQEPSVSPLSLSPGVGTVYSPSTNPSLDAYNQALTNAQAQNAALNNPNTLAALSNAAAAATPAQLTQAAAALTPASTSSLSTYLGQSTIVTGYTNGMVLAGAAVLGVLGVSLIKSSGKKKR